MNKGKEETRKPDVVITLLFENPRGSLGLTSPLDGRIDINSTYIKNAYPARDRTRTFASTAVSLPVHQSEGLHKIVPVCRYLLKRNKIIKLARRSDHIVWNMVIITRTIW